MSSHDVHLHTGEYDPSTYWDARARSSGGNKYKAVCVYRLSDELNRAAERVQEHFLRQALSTIDLRGRAVLEIGCGIGRWVDLIETLGGQYEGADISQEMIRIASTRRADIQFSHLSDCRLPYGDNSQDLVFSVTVLHHNPFDQQDRMIAEAMRVLRPGGHLLILEAVSHGRSQQKTFNMFPRSRHDWIAATTMNGRADLVSVQFIRLWLLAVAADRCIGLVKRLIGGARPAKEGSAGSPLDRIHSAIVRLANTADIRIQYWIPEILAESAIFLVRKATAETDAKSAETSAGNTTAWRRYDAIGTGPDSPGRK